MNKVPLLMKKVPLLMKKVPLSQDLTCKSKKVPVERYFQEVWQAPRGNIRPNIEVTKT